MALVFTGSSNGASVWEAAHKGLKLFFSVISDVLSEL